MNAIAPPISPATFAIAHRSSLVTIQALEILERTFGHRRLLCLTSEDPAPIDADLVFISATPVIAPSRYLRILPPTDKEHRSMDNALRERVKRMRWVPEKARVVVVLTTFVGSSGLFESTGSVDHYKRFTEALGGLCGYKPTPKKRANRLLVREKARWGRDWQ